MIWRGIMGPGPAATIVGFIGDGEELRCTIAMLLGSRVGGAVGGDEHPTTLPLSTLVGDKARDGIAVTEVIGIALAEMCLTAFPTAGTPPTRPG